MEYQLIASQAANSNLSAVEQVLLNRGIKLQDINHYLNTTDDDILNPILIARIKDGAKMLAQHIQNNDLIFFQVDPDVDGNTSSAFLLNYLHRLFPSFVENNIIYRLQEGKQHGLILETIPEGVKLVIAPDSSSNDYEEHKYLHQERNIDVLIIDHHEAEKISPDACVINNQLCDYPTKSLSGVGMVYKFCSYMDELLGVNYAENYIDLVALGLIGDMMDLRDFETKRLIEKGLSHVTNPFFKEMIKKNSFSLRGELTPMGVAFYIAPYANATIRMGTLEEKILLFESMLDFKAYDEIPSTKRGCKGQSETIVEQVCRNCMNIKSRQTKARDASLEIIETLIEENHLLENKILMIQLDEHHTINKNLTGLIANQLMAKYQRPVLLLNKVITQSTVLDRDMITPVSAEKITWEGSGRGYDKSRLIDFKAFLNDSHLVEYAEGHANAFGVCILDTNYQTLVQYCNKALANFDFSPCYKVDFIFDGSNFKPQGVLDIAGLKSIWGQGVSEPLIAFEHIKVTKDNIRLMSPDKNPTLKIILSNGTSLIKFKSSHKEYELLCPEEGYVSINVVGRCESNEWNGTISPQIIVEDYDIENIVKYYF